MIRLFYQNPHHHGLVGNEKIKKILAGAFLQNRQGHSYILEGVPGSGKHTAALLTAAAIACTNHPVSHFDSNQDEVFPCGRCEACQKVLNGHSPDVIYIQKGTKATIGVEQIRQLREELYISPNETEKKTYIIEDADSMTPAAQNALLLSLEEPPAHVFYLLLTQDASLLLETIRSRAPILRMERIDSDKIYDFLLENEKSAKLLEKKEPGALMQLVVSAEGIIGTAIQLLEAKKSAEFLEKRQLALKLVESLRLPALPEAYDVVSTLPQKREELIEILKIAQKIIRDILLSKNTPNVPLIFFAQGDEQLKKMISKFNRQRLNVLYQLFEETIDALKSNVHIGTYLSALISREK